MAAISVPNQDDVLNGILSSFKALEGNPQVMTITCPITHSVYEVTIAAEDDIFVYRDDTLVAEYSSQAQAIKETAEQILDTYVTALNGVLSFKSFLHSPAMA